MKKIILLFILFLSILPLFACKNKKEEEKTNNAIERYEYSDGIHQFNVEDVKDKYIVK